MTNASVEIVLSVVSLSVTLYFWFVRSRNERPQLTIYQIQGFRAMTRRHQSREDAKRFGVQQLDSCGVLVANNSTRQNSIVLFDCWLLLPDGTQIKGDWGTVGEDRPPWNIGPESTIAMGLACFFDVPVDFEVPETYEIGVEFISASGKRYAHTFTPTLPETATDSNSYSSAA